MSIEYVVELIADQRHKAQCRDIDAKLGFIRAEYYGKMGLRPRAEVEQKTAIRNMIKAVDHKGLADALEKKIKHESGVARGSK